MKRFTETTKWEDPWFRRLSLEAKLLWLWLCDHCDQAGVIAPDLELASFQVGSPTTEATMEELGLRVEKMPNGKLFIPKFVQFQYGKLSRACKPHMPVFAAMEKHGINPDSVSQNETFKNTVDDYVRRRILERDGLRCAYSGNLISEEEAVIDHIHPRSKGGTPTDDNLVVASAKMNSLKADLHVHRFCIAQSLDTESVFQRLSNATGKPIEAFQDPSIGYLGSLKEKDKDKDKDSSRARAREAKAKAPIEDVIEFTRSQNLPDTDGEACFWKWEANGWTNGGKPIKDWKATIRSWKAAGLLPSQRHNGSHKPQQQTGMLFPGYRPDK